MFVPAKTIHMLVDARSTPPRIAAVLLLNGKVYYSDMEPSSQAGDCFELKLRARPRAATGVQVLRSFRAREDGQIMSLELLSIAFGRCSRTGVPQCVCARNGDCRHVHFRELDPREERACPQRQHGCAAHDGERDRQVFRPHVCYTWNMVSRACALFGCVGHARVLCRTKALELGTGLYIGRVPSKDNLSDDPSREKYDLLERLEAVHVEPWLSPEFERAQSWEALSLLCRQPCLSHDQ